MNSIIIPTYNAEKTICRSLDSALAQAADVEIVLADDGSTDATLRLAEKYGDRVRILRLPHGGVSVARNAGLDTARGEWVLFLDSDDTLLPGALDRLLPAMTDDVDAVCGTICRGNKTPRPHGGEAICLTGHALMDYVLADPTNRLTIHAWAFRIRPDMPRFDPALRLGGRTATGCCGTCIRPGKRPLSPCRSIAIRCRWIPRYIAGGRNRAGTIWPCWKSSVTDRPETKRTGRCLC